MTKETAIQAIVTFNTLPPQIDYTEPWRIKAYYAEKFLNTLSKKERKEAYKEAERQIDAYYAPDGAAYMDSLF